MIKKEYKDYEIIPPQKISVYGRTRELFQNKINICLIYDTMIRYTMLRLNYSA